MFKILITKTVLSFEFRYWDLFRIWCLEFRIPRRVVIASPFFTVIASRRRGNPTLPVIASPPFLLSLRAERSNLGIVPSPLTGEG
jgi:hypothetical protein